MSLAGAEPATVLSDSRRWLDVGRPLDRFMYCDTTMYLPDDILVKVDRAAMAVSLETRIPMLDHRVAEKRSSYPPPRPEAPVTVSVDNGVSEFFTVIEVGGPDRIGLLFDITRTLADLRLDVHLAKVATYGGRVVDAFYVRDSLGHRIEDPQRIGEIERAVLERIPA